MMADVAKADVVAMNPTHYAVALRYDAKTMKAPRVVAKGADLVAFQIRRVAEAHKVPVFEHPQFARALFHTSEIGKEISPRLYVAVAQVLTYIYQLTGRTAPRAKRGRTSSPSPGQPNPSPGQPKSKPKMPALVIDPDLIEPRRGRAAFTGVEA
jgi:flagellar biosynthetic protein FlhB